MCQNSVLQNLGDVKNEVFEKKIACFVFPFLCWKNWNKKRKWKRPKKPIKIGVFKRVVIQKCEKKQKLKNGFFAKIAWHHFGQEGRKNAHFRAHYLFWPNIFLDQNSVNQEKLKKKSGFSGNCPKPKMTPFFENGVFWHGWKSGFYCAFEKLCFSGNTIFIVFSAKHSFSKAKMVCWKEQKIYEK